MGPSEVRSTGTTWDPRFIHVPYGAWLVLTTLIFHKFQSDFLPQMFNPDGLPKNIRKMEICQKLKERSRRRRRWRRRRSDTAVVFSGGNVLLGPGSAIRLCVAASGCEVVDEDDLSSIVNLWIYHHNDNLSIIQTYHYISTVFCWCWFVLFCVFQCGSLWWSMLLSGLWLEYLARGQCCGIRSQGQNLWIQRGESQPELRSGPVFRKAYINLWKINGKEEQKQIVGFLIVSPHTLQLRFAYTQIYIYY